jgi:CheY-like chemotaxis protein
LIVDVESETRTLLSKALTQLGGFQIDVSENAEETLTNIEKDPLDLVPTNLKMPKIDRLVLIRRNIHRLTKIPNDLLSLSTVESGMLNWVQESSP